MKSIASTVQEARRVASTMGTWVIHEAARAENHEELIGFVRYCAQGLEKLYVQAKAEEAEAHGAKSKAEASKRTMQIRTWIGEWRRATRWLMSLDAEQARAVAEAVLRQLEGEAYYVPCGHPYLREDSTPPRRSVGRPRVRALASKYRECGECGGFGWR